MNKNLSNKDQLQFIKACIKNPSIKDMDSSWFCNWYDEEDDKLYYLNKLLLKLNIIEEIKECYCSYLAEYWPSNAVKGYWYICQEER